jgi:thiamine-phosphate pyrophosphorylase
VLRCAITDRTIFPGNDDQRLDALVQQAALWSRQGIELIQLREKDLPTPVLTNIARRILQQTNRSILIVNSSLDAAIAARAHGVHVSFQNPAASHTEILERYAAAGLPTPIVTVSCHTLNQVRQASATTPDAILFAPVFGKTVGHRFVSTPTGLDALRDACRLAHPIPVIALGGVTLGRARLCLQAGAAGVAGIRLFHNHLS